MNTLVIEIEDLRVSDVRIGVDSLTVDLTDGRTLSVPLAWFPRLLAGTSRERAKWRLIGGGEGIHWADLDEDISVEGLLAGRASMESQPSISAWLRARQKRTRGGNAKGRRLAAGSSRRGQPRG